jgi:sulfonate transport system permease protein
MANQLKANLRNNRLLSQTVTRSGAGQSGRSGFVLPYNLISWLVPLAVLGTWELLVRTGVILPRILPAPSTVIATGWQLILNGVLPKNLWVSLGRAATGFVIGSVIALALGFTVGLSRLAEALIDRTIQMIRTIPFLSILPLVIVWFGIGESGKIFLVALGVTFPIYINTVLGIRQVEPRLLELGRNYGLNKQQLVWQVILPGALPSILVGFRYALGIAWLALVVAETIGASAGIGFMAMDAREFLRTDVIVLAIVIYASLGIVVDVIIRFLERRLLVWHPNYAKRSR